VNQVTVAQNGAIFQNRSLYATLGDTLLSSIFTAAAAILLLAVVRRITTEQARIAP
jgi:hypothetical protein